MRVRDMAIDDIHPYPNNPRQNDDAVAAVAASIQEFGFKQPIVVDADMTVIVGHTRLKAAQSLGLESVPVLVADDLTAEQVAAYRLADNRTGELAEWDLGLLDVELDGLQGFDMGRFGFDGFDEAMKTPEEQVADVVEDEEPDLEEVETRCHAGELWRLGDHVLLCADATDAAELDRLLGGGGTLIDLLLTDPPYGVAYTGGTADELTIENDDLEDAEFVAFLTAALSPALDHMRAGAAYYLWHADTRREPFIQALEACDAKVRQVLVWVKNTFALGRQDYQWQHEPCLYGWKEGAAHYFGISRSETTVLEDVDLKTLTKAQLLERLEKIQEEAGPSTAIRCDRPARNAEHPTMKPVRLIAYLMANSSRKGDAVLDIFAGSGTTLIAAEQLGRRCYAMELDPKYCDVIIERWEKLTGRCAKRIG